MPRSGGVIRLGLSLCGRILALLRGGRAGLVMGMWWTMFARWLVAGPIIHRICSGRLLPTPRRRTGGSGGGARIVSAARFAALQRLPGFGQFTARLRPGFFGVLAWRSFLVPNVPGRSVTRRRLARIAGPLWPPRAARVLRGFRRGLCPRKKAGGGGCGFCWCQRFCWAWFLQLRPRIRTG